MLSALIGVFTLGMLVAKHGEPCERLHKAHEWMKDSLNLTEAQKIKVNAIKDSACARLSAVRADVNLDKEARQAKAKQIMGDMKTDLKEVLTPEQLEKLKAHRKSQEKHGNRQEKHALTAEEKAGKMAAHLKTELGLDEAQELKVKSAVLELINQRESVKNNAEIKTEEDGKTAMKAARLSFNKTMKEILDDEQEVKWKEMKKKTHNRQDNRKKE